MLHISALRSVSLPSAGRSAARGRPRLSSARRNGPSRTARQGSALACCAIAEIAGQLSAERSPSGLAGLLHRRPGRE